MTDFKSKLGEVHDRLVELEGEARKLRNQNLADQIGHTLGRLSMAMNHPDLDNVGREEPLPPHTDPLNSGGNLQFAAGDPGVKLQAEEAARRDAFGHDAANRDPVTGQPNAAWTPPGAVAGPSAGEPVTGSDPEAHHPGDPEFRTENNNPDFRDPNNVDLNSDGTLKTAPNSAAGVDERDKG